MPSIRIDGRMNTWRSGASRPGSLFAIRRTFGMT